LVATEIKQTNKQKKHMSTIQKLIDDKQAKLEILKKQSDAAWTVYQEQEQVFIKTYTDPWYKLYQETNALEEEIKILVSLNKEGML
jgi:hypothetical protein